MSTVNSDSKRILELTELLLNSELNDRQLELTCEFIEIVAKQHASSTDLLEKTTKQNAQLVSMLDKAVTKEEISKATPVIH